jgi:gliding motility-associated-like protein
MQKVLSISILVLLCLPLQAQQNLVPNGDFEHMDSCPVGPFGIDYYLTNWFSPLGLVDVGSSDYMNKCVSQVLGINWQPNGFHQAPVSGDGLVGILLSELYILGTVNGYINYDYREYIEVELTSVLEKDCKYCYEFHYNLADQFYAYYKPVDISVLLTDTIVKRYFRHYMSPVGPGKHHLPIEAPEASFNTMISHPDTINWQKVSGSMVAKGGEKFLTIGSFAPVDTTTVRFMYIFIEDVRLWKCGEAPKPIQYMKFPNIFTPNADGVNDFLLADNEGDWSYSINIFNRWGQLVFSGNQDHHWDGQIKGSPAAEGVYYYMVTAKAIRSNEEKEWRGTVTLMR